LYDNVCILSVLAQCAIDNAKRKFDIDITEEIALIKRSMDIDTRGYPAFWGVIRKGFDKKKINKKLKCPMNYIYRLKPDSYNPETSTLPIQHFFIKHKNTDSHKVSRRVEKMIEKYSLKLLLAGELDNTDENLFELLNDDFEKMIEDIRSIYLSRNYLGLISRLIDRAFIITDDLKRRKSRLSATTRNNRAILLKTLYTVNPDAFLACFKG